MHVGSIAAFFMLVIGFVLGFFAGYSWLAWNFLLAAIGLLLFLILRESTLSQLPDRGSSDSGRPAGPGRTTNLPSEAATMQSSPAPPPPPSPPRPRQ